MVGPGTRAPADNSLVREDAGDAPISGCEDSQEAVPGRRGAGTPAVSGVWLCPCPHSPSQPPDPHSVPSQCCPSPPPPRPHLRVEVLVLPDPLHQLLCDARVQDQVVQEEVVALGGRWREGGKGGGEGRPHGGQPCPLPPPRSIPALALTLQWLPGPQPRHDSPPAPPPPTTPSPANPPASHPPQAIPSYSHCLESGVTFSMRAIKFSRNSVLLSDKSRSLQYSLGFGGQGLSFARTEKARSVLPQGRRGRRWPCCQHLGLLRDTTVVTCHRSRKCHPTGAAGCGHLCRLPSTQLSAACSAAGSAVTPATGSVTATGSEVPSPLPGLGLMNPSLPTAAQP